jgi:VanZ family protein
LNSPNSFYRAWVPVILWTAIIIVESGFGSSANTGSILQKLAAWLFGHVDPARFDLIHHILRKGGHFFGYGILGYLWFRGFTRSLQNSTRFACATWAIVCTFIIASLDEYHQSFSSARTGQFSDVLLDTCGAIVLIGTAMLMLQRRREARV